MAFRAPAFRITAIDCFERRLRYRLPFRFGAATLTHGVQAFVRVGIRLEDGCEAVGAAAELMVPKWFDKDPALSNDENIDQLRQALAIARSGYLDSAGSRTAFGHFASNLHECRDEARRTGLPALAAGFGPAEIDKAVLDALCRALNVPFFEAVRRNLIGFEPASVAPDLADADAAALLESLDPRWKLALRHTVGMADVLRGHPGGAGDGLPESLEESIAAYGPRWFKLKLSGDAASDLARLRDIATVLDTLPVYHVTLDGNEQFSAAELIDLLRALREDPPLQRLVGAIAFVEQPFPRQQTFEFDVHSIASTWPMLIDEADAALDAFPQARGLGYAGVSSKSCKGLYKSLVNALRCATWNASTGGADFFLSAEDLTTPAGLALQQDLALASLLGVAHTERNGHHYIDGMASAPAGEQHAFLARHADMYEESHGAVRLKVRDGELAIGSLDCPGFASGALPDWDALAPMVSQTTSSTHGFAQCAKPQVQ